MCNFIPHEALASTEPTKAFDPNEHDKVQTSTFRAGHREASARRFTDTESGELLVARGQARNSHHNPGGTP